MMGDDRRRKKHFSVVTLAEVRLFIKEIEHILLQTELKEYMYRKT